MKFARVHFSFGATLQVTVTGATRWQNFLRHIAPVTVTFMNSPPILKCIQFARSGLYIRIIRD